MNILGVALLALFAQNASMQGIVVKDGGGDPLSKANVELRADGPDGVVLDNTTTEDDGRFLFQNVRPGRYRLMVTRPGYTRPPLTITIADGQDQLQLRLPMKPTAAIYGRVVDSKGEPLGNVEVQALAASYPEGRRVLSLVRSVQTNDLGEYRLFWLPLGRYYVAAVHPQAEGSDEHMFRIVGFGVTMLGSRGIFLSSANNTDPALGLERLLEPDEPQVDRDRYVPIYFPGTIDEQSASAVDLHNGRDIGGVNMVIAPVRARHVRGIVIDGATGRPARNASVSIAHGLEFPRVAAPAVDPDNGSFDLLLLPGSHVLTANASTGAGYTVVHVGDADVENLTIPTTFLFTIRGRITVEGQNNPQLGELHISLRRDPAPPRGSSLPASYSNPLPDGSFNVEGAPGDFRISIAPILNAGSAFPVRLPPNLKDAYVKSIRLGSVDVLNDGLHLEKKPDTTLDVVLGTNPGAVEGIVLNDAGQPAGDVAVVLLPDVRRRIDLYMNTTTDPSGRFRFERVPSGDYKIFAWMEVENGSWYDADFMRDSENRGTSIRVQEGRKEEIQVRTIP